MPNNIDKFNEQQQKNQEGLMANISDQFSNDPLTDKEEAEVASMKDELGSSAIIIRDGNKEVSFDDFVQPLDNAIPTLADGTKLMAMAPSNITNQSIKNSIIKQFSTGVINELTVNAESASEDEVRGLMHETLAAIKKHLGVDKIRKEQAMAALSNCSLTDLTAILPRRLFDLYISPQVWKTARNTIKNTILMIVDCMITAGPESDEFSEYMENQSKIYAVLQALSETNFKVKDLVESKEKFSEIATKVLKRANPQMLDFSKYVKSPDSINLVFSQRAEINREFAAAYRNLRANYTDPIELEAIDKEIDEADYKAEMYEAVLELKRFTVVLDMLAMELLNSKKDKTHSLDKLAKKGLEKIKQANLEVPFPGYTGTERNVGELYINFVKHFRHHSKLYNDFVCRINESEGQNLPTIENVETFCNILLIVMSRIQKRLTKNTATYREKNELVIYFELICRFCSDIFTTAKAVGAINKFEKTIKKGEP